MIVFIIYTSETSQFLQANLLGDKKIYPPENIPYSAKPCFN